MLSNVDDYIEQLPVPQNKLARQVRQLLLNLVPEIVEKLSFKIPFYHYYGMFCYINKVPNGIDVGFCRGKDLSDEFPQLEIKGRAIVATVTIVAPDDIKQKELREIIVAAALWNKEAKKNKIPMVKKSKK